MHRVEANGARIPAIGLGTWTLDDAAAEAMVRAALGVGYRHIDTAVMYGNETGVGAGLRAGGVARDEVFVTTKIWPDQIADGALQAALEGSLTRLGLDMVDLALIHWPSPTIPLAESIGALNDARTKGLTRHIGVSNFNAARVREAARLSAHPLVCNQIENHPLLDQERIMAANRALGLATTSYCPLARGGALFEEPAVASPAARLGVSPAQVVLRWHVQQDGVVAIPRTTNPARLEENLSVFDFSLEPEEMTAIGALRTRGLRLCEGSEHAPEWTAA
ncbi:aldo/keto reductase [Pikeienuella sp. HZG-20]|uniref:aldo/keto reductase n=1 Tax=Paludibacillus litoralis TaxID=3133267 RepID=UPI0030EC4127